MTDAVEPTRVVVFTTGGTIASVDDPAKGGVVPSGSAASLVDGLAIPGIAVEAVELARVSSMAITPSQVLDWSRRVAEVLEREDVRGAVLTTGTNAMEEVAFLLDLLHVQEKPLVVTGAMRPASAPAPDGPGNLRDAVLVAATAGCRGLGVLVTLNGTVHAAGHVRKASGQRLDAFVSPTSGPVARLDRRAAGDEVRLLTAPSRLAAVRPDALEEHVALVTAGIGVDSRPIHCALDAGAKGLVVEAFAGGDLTPQMADGVERALSSGIPVVVASRGWNADPTDTYAGRGEGAWLRQLGAHLARDLSAHKARLLLMVVLGAQHSERLSEYFK